MKNRQNRRFLPFLFTFAGICDIILKQLSNPPAFRLKIKFQLNAFFAEQIRKTVVKTLCRDKRHERKNKLNSTETEITESTAASGGEKRNAPKKKKSESFTEKLNDLWRDKRKLSSRLITSLAASIAFVFTFLVFGPLEIYISNMAFFAFSGKYLFAPAALMGIAVAAVMTGILILLRGKIYNYAVSLVISLTVAGYIQGNFLNIDHGTLDGSEVVWQNFKAPAMLGILFWAVMIIIPLAVQYFSRKVWKYAVRFAALILVGAQSVALITLAAKTDFSNVSDDGFLSKDKIYEVAPDKNVVFFLLDRFDKKWADMQLKNDPELEKQLSGFTYYENLTGSYSRTCPSVTYLLTGVKCDYEIPMSDYFRKAWSEGSFLRQIRKAGFESRVYSDIPYVMEKSEYGKDAIDNIGYPTHSVNRMKILSAMYGLSAYRYLPEAFKPYYHIYTGDISYGFIYGGSNVRNNVYSIDDIAFRKGLVDNRLTVDENSKGAFIFYHLQGAHDPFRMDENGKLMTGQEYTEKGRHKQIKGDLNTIFRYIKQLKELGVYENTTIIISADHGETGYYEKLNRERVLACFIKPAGEDGSTPMKRSQKQICQDNLRASISSYFGLELIENGKHIRTVEEIGEDEQVTRYFWMNGTDGGAKRDFNLITYEITGDANDFSNWKIVSTERIKYPYYDASKKSK